MKLRRRRETPDQEYERLQREQGQREQRANEDRAREIGRQRRKATREGRRTARQSGRPAPTSLRLPRLVALAAIAVVIGAASLTSLAESYRGLFDWSHEHGLSGTWVAVWPLQVDSFIVVGELALFVGLADLWTLRQRIGAWAVTLAGLAVSVAGNVGHVQSHLLSDRATAAVPPLAAFAALWVGLGVLKRVVGQHAQPPLPSARDGIPADVVEAAKASMRATIAAGNPWSVNGLQNQFSLTRAQATEVRQTVLSETNGHQATT